MAVIPPIRPISGGFQRGGLEEPVFSKERNTGPRSRTTGGTGGRDQSELTDSINHILAGALYFYAKPNYDSIIPALKYIEKDMVRLIETIEWNKKEM